MQNILVEKPYRFVPAYPGQLWARRLRGSPPRYRRRAAGLVATESRGTEHRKESIRQGHGILPPPTRYRPHDPLVIGLLNEHSGRPIHTMASWHLFTES